MGGTAKRTRLSAEAYAARATDTSSDLVAVDSYCKAMCVLALELDDYTTEKCIALARTYMNALTNHVRRLRGDYGSAPEMDDECLDEKTVDMYHLARLDMAWVLSTNPVPDFDEIDGWLGADDGWKDLRDNFYGAIACRVFEDCVDSAFSDHSLSFYRAYFRIFPVKGAFAYALGLLARTPVDAAAIADVVVASGREDMKRLLLDLVHADTRAKFEHVLFQHFDDCVSLNQHCNKTLYRCFGAVLEHRFGTIDE